jgi:dipeptidyl aminopeptidase/acylaminoacyl peptidase
MSRFVCAVLCSAAVFAQPRPLTPDDLATAFTQVSAIAGSENSADLIYRIAGKGWLRLSTGAAAPLPAAAADPRWSPGGQRLAYFFQNAIHVLDWTSGKSHKVCDAPAANTYLAHTGARLTWSPGGNSLVFAGTLEPAPARSDPIVITRVLYKTRTGLSDNRRTHLYLVPVEGGQPRLLTPGDYDAHSPDWSAGEEIVFLANRRPNADAVLNYDLHAVNPATGAVRQIADTPGTEMTPRLSPDGRQIAFAATTRAITTIDSIAEDAHIYTIPAAGGHAAEVNPALDRRCSGPQWQGTSVLYACGDHGKTVPFKDRARILDERAQISALTPHRGRYYYLRSDPASPRELWVLDAGQPRQATRLNAGSPGQFSTPEEINFRSFDGTPIQGWLYPPLKREGRWPLLLSVHGGPHGAYGYAFNETVHVHAARGYATLLVNPRGSSGYGQRFSDGCVNNWGGGDYRDLMAAVDYVLKKYPQTDPGRLGVIGGSYGGFMTNWIVTQTRRFKAAVSIASVSNLISFYATSLYQDLVHAEFGGYPWDAGNFEKLWRWSPIRHVRQVSTPVMFLHGELDNDVHITQAEEMYTALRQRGVEAVLVRYPGEGHGFSQPRHQKDRLVRSLEWFDRFLRP